MNRLFKNWSVMRVVRLVMAVFIIYQGVLIKEWLFVIAGLLFALMPLLNFGCCSTSGCTSDNKTTMKNSKEEPTSYTEIK